MYFRETRRFVFGYYLQRGGPVVPLHLPFMSASFFLVRKESGREGRRGQERKKRTREQCHLTHRWRAEPQSETSLTHDGTGLLSLSDPSQPSLIQSSASLSPGEGSASRLIFGRRVFPDIFGGLNASRAHGGCAFSISATDIFLLLIVFPLPQQRTAARLGIN